MVNRPVTTSGDHLESLVAVLDLIRHGDARTRPELGRLSGLGRMVITQRVAELTAAGLVREGQFGRSTGGRAPRELEFHRKAGLVLVAQLGATGAGMAVGDLTGRLLHHVEEPGDIAAGPETVLARVEEVFDELLTREPEDQREIWGIGIGVPGPVEFASGRPVAPPIMPGWDGYSVRDRLAKRYNAPVWADNEVNLMLLGEYRGGLARGVADAVFIKIGTGIGAGLISAGRLHRGAQGCAGDVGHVATAEAEDVLCRCGNRGCLEAVAGSAAIVRDATAAAAEGRSEHFAAISAQRPLTRQDVARAAEAGDPVAHELLARSGRLVGGILATVVNLFNPELVVVGGGVPALGDVVLANIRQAVYTRSPPLATRDLRIVRSPPHNRAGLNGAAYMVVDELFSRDVLQAWLPAGSPVGQPTVVGA